MLATQALAALYPRPRRIVRLAGEVSKPDRLHMNGPGSDIRIPDLTLVADAERAWLHCELDDDNLIDASREAYRLQIEAGGARLTARSTAGLRAGLTTISQLFRAAVLPACIIDDAPAFDVRGFMLDISRDRVPTMDCLYELLTQMARCKLNHLQLYNEHAIAYEGHEAVWRSADPLTFSEIDSLDAAATRLGISLCANQNTLGHMERWLKHPAYAHLGEVAGPRVMGENLRYRSPNTLCATDPGSLELVGDLLRQLTPHCSDPRCHIGGDEPYDLGAGRSATAVAKLGRSHVFSEYLRQVAELSLDCGKRPMFWCDPKPNEDMSLPEELIALVWGYEFDTEFLGRAQAHRACGREVWVCPGTSNWQTTTSRTRHRRDNLRTAAREGLQAGARGFVNTEWGDRGHLQQWPLTLFGMAEGAQSSWAGDAEFEAEVAAQCLWREPTLGPWLAGLGRVDEAMNFGQYPGGHRLRNISALGRELHLTPLLQRTDEAEHAAWLQVACALEALGPPPGSSFLTQECEWNGDLSKWVAGRALSRHAGPSRDERSHLVHGITELIARYRELWLARSRYGGYEDSVRHLERHAVWW